MPDTAALTESQTRPVKLLICDDSIFMRMAIRTICEDHPEIDVVGEAKDGAEAIRLVSELAPDVITMDIDMPGVNGAAATDSIVKRFDTPVVIISGLTQRRSAVADRLREIGASDVIWKSASLMDIDIDGIASLIIKKVLYWGGERRSAA